MIDKAMNDKDRFTMTELAALRNDLLQGGMIDSYEAAELLQVFLMGRGYGVSPKAALDAAGRVEMAGCALPVLQLELENLAIGLKASAADGDSVKRHSGSTLETRPIEPAPQKDSRANQPGFVVFRRLIPFHPIALLEAPTCATPAEPSAPLQIKRRARRQSECPA